MSFGDLTLTLTQQSSAAIMESSTTLKHCSACDVNFESDEIRRAHAKSQWHVENIKRRVAGLPPIEASAVTPTIDKSKTSGIPDVAEESSSSVESDEESANEELSKFVAEQCLFCQETSATFDANVSHMERAHGLYIRDLKRLSVDLETLVRYFHLVIFGYRECLYCHSQRRTVQAAQQHMTGKGHCRIDIESPDSEYRDFLDTAENSAKDGADAGIGPSSDGDLARLPSGRIVSSRTSKHVSHSRQPQHSSDPLLTTPGLGQGPVEPENTQASSTPSDTSSSQAIMKNAKREGSLATQLSSLRVGDRASLAHLSSSQQLAVLATQKKQAAKARRVEQRYRSRVEMTGNRTLMGNFVSDIYGGLPVQMYG